MGIYDAITQKARMTEADIQNRILDAQLKDQALAERQQRALRTDRETIIEAPDALTDTRKRQIMQSGTMAGMDMSPAGAGEGDATLAEQILAFGGGMVDSALFGLVPDSMYSDDRTKGASAAGKFAGTAALIGLSLMPGLQGVGISKLLGLLGKKGAVAAKGAMSKKAATEVSKDAATRIGETLAKQTGTKAAKEGVKKGVSDIIKQAGSELGTENVPYILYQLFGTAQPIVGTARAAQEASRPYHQRKSSPYFIDPSWQDMQMLQGMDFGG